MKTFQSTVLKVFGDKAMESPLYQRCSRCGRAELNIYYSSAGDGKWAAWCRNCDLRAQFDGHEIIYTNGRYVPRIREESTPAEPESECESYAE